MPRTSLLLVVILAACASTDPDAPGPDAGAGSGGDGGVLPPAAPDVPFDQAVMASAHNAFEREEPLFDQLVYDGIRSIELDIHASKNGTAAPAGDWFVYHEDIDVPGFRVSSCTQLSDCLRLVTAFHAAAPQHEVITLWFDLKANVFSPDHDAAGLDAALAHALGRENIVTPGDLLARCPGAIDLRGAITMPCRFPTLGELRGKFIIAVTGGSACTASDLVNVYGGATPTSHLAFLAPETSASCPVPAYDGHRDVAILNMVYEQRARSAEARARGMVARVYRGLTSFNNENDFLAAKAAGANHLAMDMLNPDEDPWSSTTSATGYPFECVGCEPPLAEAVPIVTAGAQSGDLGGTSDSMMFAAAAPSSEAEVWTSAVSVPSSHVEALAKGCLVARANIAPGAMMVAVCRAFDQQAPVVLWRMANNDAAMQVSAPTLPGHRAETPAYLRLALAPASSGSTAFHASISVDGQTWVELASGTIPADLRLRGLAVASKAAVPVRALFLSPYRADVTSHVTPLTASAFPAVIHLGDGTTGDVFDGLHP